MRTSKYPNVTRGQEEAVYNKLGGEQGLADFLAGKTIVIEAKDAPIVPLFECLGPHTAPAIGEFAVADKMRPGQTIDGITIGWIDDNLKRRYHPKKEPATPKPIEVLEHQLLRSSNDLPKNAME